MNSSTLLREKNDLYHIVFIAIFSVAISLGLVYYPSSFAILLAIVFIGALSVLLLKKPVWFLYFFALSKISLDAIKLHFLNVRELDLRYALSIDGLLTGIFLLSFIFYLVKRRAKVDIFRLPGTRPFVLFLLICLFSLSFSPEKLIGIRHFTHYLTYFFIYLFCANLLDSREKNRRMVYAILLSSIVPLFTGFYQAFTGKGSVATPGFNRIYATTAHPNAYAYYLMIMAMFILTLIFYFKPVRVKALVFALFIPVITSLIFTYTRGAWFGFLLGVSIFILMLMKKINLKSGIILIVITCIFLLYFIFSFPVIERIGTVLEVGRDSFWSRVLLWQMYFEEFLKHPLIGQGLGSCSLIAERNMGYVYAPHNDYLKLIVETGIFGLFAYLAVLLSLLRFFLNKYKNSVIIEKKILAAGVISLFYCIFLSQCVENFINADVTFSYFWVLIGFGYSVIQRKEAT